MRVRLQDVDDLVCRGGLERVQQLGRVERRERPACPACRRRPDAYARRDARIALRGLSQRLRREAQAIVARPSHHVHPLQQRLATQVRCDACGVRGLPRLDWGQGEGWE